MMACYKFKTASSIQIPCRTPPLAVNVLGQKRCVSDPEPLASPPSGRTIHPDTVLSPDGKIPHTWTVGLARLGAMPRPNDIPTVQWLLIVKAGVVFAEHWAEKAFHLGWITEEVFGVHADAPTVRYGSQGLLFSMADDNATLVEMDASQAVFRTANGARQVLRRDTFNMDCSPLRMLYEILIQQEKVHGLQQ